MKQFNEVEGLKAVYAITKGNLRSVAILLSDKSICVISPLAALPPSAYASLESIGPVRHALAPNHYHNKGISEFSKAFPNAKIYATQAATSRLEERTSARFMSLSKLSNLLRREMSFVEPEGLKTGEVWMRFTAPKLRSWLVVDAFCGPKLTAPATEADKPELLTTFPNYGISDQVRYCAWAQQQLKKDKPKLMIPCHGSIVRSSKLPANIAILLRKLEK